MKKQKPEPPHDFEVEDADAAFGKLEDATRRLFASHTKDRHRPVKKSKSSKNK